MFELMVETHFSAAHHLLNYQGKCERPHGHNYVVQIWVQGETLDKANILYDYKVLKGYLKSVTEPLDHIDLNEFEAFKGESPSSEFLSQYVYKKLKPLLPHLVKTCVFETPTACAYYYEN
jgi:6-pyruvoyltetrahydropterin/6-carboxytetrahydropterin synthase